MLSTKLKNARFLFWANDGFVKITLKPGQALSHFTSQSHEEGFSSCYTYFNYDKDDNSIYMEVSTSDRDCDGLHSSEREFICPIDKLASYRNFYGDMIPDWEEASYSQRDAFAEAMNY